MVYVALPAKKPFSFLRTEGGIGLNRQRVVGREKDNKNPGRFWSAALRAEWFFPLLPGLDFAASYFFAVYGNSMEEEEGKKWI